MPDSPLKISYRLNRRERWRAHLAMWFRYWPGMVFMIVLPLGIVITLAVESSPWFLLLILILTNFWRFMAGIIHPLLYGPQCVDIVVEEKRLGFAESGKELMWRELEWLEAIDQFTNDVWAVQFQDGVVLHVPMEKLSAVHVERMRTFIERQPVAACGIKTQA